MTVWLSPAQVAERAGISVVTIYREVRAGRLPHYKIAGGRLLRFREADVEAWLTRDRRDERSAA